ncbi:MAG: hypothetical protein ACQEW8_00765 [Actinomycetota bacterium]
MRYLFGTGLFGAITAGRTLLRGSRDEPFTWRAALAWLSWGITAALTIGAIVDARREKKGLPVASDSPFRAKQEKKAKKASR